MLSQRFHSSAKVVTPVNLHRSLSPAETLVEILKGVDKLYSSMKRVSLPPLLHYRLL